MPTLILQGERDPFGQPGEARTDALSPQPRVEWIPSGDHSFKPRRDSGRGEADNCALAVALADRFCQELLGQDSSASAL